jgi:hypothetical protein
MLDETEIETIPNARPVIVVETGEIVESTNPPGQSDQAPATNRHDSIYVAIVAAGLSENEFAAKTALTKYCKTGYDTEDKAIAWMRRYRGWRDLGGTPEQAAKNANEGKEPSADYSKAEAVDPQIDPVDALGEQLWPGGKWEEIKVKLLESIEKVNADPLATLEARRDNILLRDVTGIKAHVEKGWSLGILVDLVSEQLKSAEFDRFAALRGVARAAAVYQDKPDMSYEQLASMVLAELEIPPEFA